MKKVEYPRDVIRIQAVAANLMGYLMTLEEAANLWEKHSNSMCASWLHLPDNDLDLIKEIYAAL